MMARHTLRAGGGQALRLQGGRWSYIGGRILLESPMPLTDTPLFDAPTPLMVLVRPQMGENIGAAARAMLNFGCARMRIVDPRDGWPNPKAVAMASGAGGVLERAGLFDTVGAAVGDCDYVFATTARGRDLTKPVLTPEHAMAQARALTAAGKRVAVLFGPERAGLENDDIARAQAIITVPVNPEFYSLNLAQCVLLVAYEFARQADGIAPEVQAMAGTDFATGIEREKWGDHLEERLEQTGFFFPETKAAAMRMNLRNMWGRLALTRADVQTLHGILRHLGRTRD
jgi:tRNA/rRNA methyltransferase